MTRFFLLSIALFSQLSTAQPDLSKASKSFSGYFDFYYFEDSDQIFLEVEKLGEEFLYVNALSQGLGSNDIGLDRGQLGATQVVFFQKAGNKLMLIQPNLDFRANTDNAAEKKSVREAFAKSVLFGFPIVTKTAKGYLIDLTPFIMQDSHGVTGRLKGSGQGNYSLDKSRSALAIDQTKAFPKNVEFDAMLTFSGNGTGRNIRSVAPNSDFVTAYQHHSFIELPDNQFELRDYDPRSGSYPFSYMDYATPVNQSITKRYTTRHRLEKKFPDQAMSEAVDPIIYYLDPGTPEPVRSALLEGASWWNQAFEAAGFINAFQVKMLPEDADPLDIRYNVIQWVHRSTRGWSYGASVADPRTGEIIKGHVSLGSLRIRQDYLIAQGLSKAPFAENGDGDSAMMALALARIRQLSAHEVGHTLGFQHNFAASANNRASVMDYPHPLISLKNDNIVFDDAYAIGIGAWDIATVMYSYSDFPDGTDETKALNNILNKAYGNGLRYISDSDARASGGAHPYAHLWDGGRSASEELDRVMAVRKKAIEQFSLDNIKDGEAVSVLEDVFAPIYFFHRYQAEAASKLIGGVEYNYATKEDLQSPRPVSAKEQRLALSAILKTLQASELAIPKAQLELFPPRSPGYGRTRESFKSQLGPIFDPMGAAATAADFTLNFLFHPERASRLVLQKAQDSNQLDVSEMTNLTLDHIKNTTYSDPYSQEVQNSINAQILSHLFALSQNDQAYPQVGMSVMSALQNLRKEMAKSKKRSSEQQFILTLLDRFFSNPTAFKPVESPNIPDGSPIGSDWCSYH
mgnify:CR=1 FL=1